jgi:uncharacterized protein YqiB (DUF1249 family)
VAKIAQADYGRAVLRKVPAGTVVKYDSRQLMWFYDINYGRMLELIAGINEQAESAVGRSDSDTPPVHLTRIDSDRYTSTWRITYLFDEAGEPVADPDIQVRLYHDSRQAVTHSCGRHTHLNMLRVIDTEQGSSFQRRWNMNVLLYKWLEYLLSKNYRWSEK